MTDFSFDFLVFNGDQLAEQYAHKGIPYENTDMVIRSFHRVKSLSGERFPAYEMLGYLDHAVHYALFQFIRRRNLTLLELDHRLMDIARSAHLMTDLQMSSGRLTYVTEPNFFEWHGWVHLLYQLVNNNPAVPRLPVDDVDAMDSHINGSMLWSIRNFIEQGAYTRDSAIAGDSWGSFGDAFEELFENMEGRIFSPLPRLDTRLNWSFRRLVVEGGHDHGSLKLTMVTLKDYRLRLTLEWNNKVVAIPYVPFRIEGFIASAMATQKKHAGRGKLTMEFFGDAIVNEVPG